MLCLLDVLAISFLFVTYKNDYHFFQLPTKRDRLPLYVCYIQTGDVCLLTTLGREDNVTNGQTCSPVLTSFRRVM